MRGDPRPLTADYHDLATEADRFLIHVRALVGVVEYAKSAGLSQAVIDAERDALDLLDVRIDAFDAFISMNRFGKLMQRFGRLVGDEAFGLRVASRAEHDRLGVLGKAVGSAPSLAVALDTLTRYMRLYADTSYAATSIADDRIEFSWAYSPLVVARDTMCDRAARLFILYLQRHYGDGVVPMEVHLQRTRPVDRAPYRELLSSKCHFDAAVNMIVLRPEVLDLPNAYADQAAFEVALALADRMLVERRVPDDFTVRVREDILAHLADQDTGVAQTAGRLSISTRSLQRRLDALDTNYQALTDAIRKALCRELLTQTRLPIGEIAYRLGFSNQANLTRACKRWFSVGPRDVRRSQP